MTSIDLLDTGYTLVRLYTPDELGEVHAQFRQLLLEFPEFDQEFLQRRSSLATPKERRLNAGGFGALNFPSAYHNPLARRLDRDIYRAVRPVLRELAHGKNLEVIPDRLMLRTHGDSPGRETVHRDLSRGLLPDDLCFGCIANLNQGEHESQYLSTCQPGSHLLHADPANKGFSKITDAGEIREFKDKKIAVEIPPGAECFQSTYR